MDNSLPRRWPYKLQWEFKVTVLSVNRFACASWFSVNGQNDEFKTDINCHKKFTACAGNGDQPTVHKESQPVPGLKLKATS